MTTLKNLTLAGAALAILAGSSLRASAQTGVAEFPTDVTEFLSRRASCNEWSRKATDEWSKEAIDRDRAAEIEAIYSNLRSLKCFDVIGDERALRQKYADNPEILASLGSGNYTKIIIRLPVRIAVPPASDR